MSDTDWYPEQPNGSDFIWRYMDITKLISILDDNELWFSNAMKFDDPYEGSSPRRDIENRVAPFIPEPADTTKEVLANLFNHTAFTTKYRLGVKKSSYMSCWHLNPHQSIAMWDRYSNEGKGIAIRSTVDNFADSIEGIISDTGNSLEKISVRRGPHDFPDEREAENNVCDPQIPIIFGKVNYIDYMNDTSFPALISPFFHKRNGYESEKEFRALLMKTVNKDKIMTGSGDYTDWLTQLPDGIRVSVSLDTLIDSVYVAPDASELFYNSVESVVRGLGSNINLKEFQPLDIDPLF